MVAWAAAHLCLLVRGGETRCCAPSGQNHQGVPWHAPKLKGKSPEEEHDEHTVDPLKDGRGVLQGKALLAKENSTWWSEVKEDNVCTAGTQVRRHKTHRCSLSWPTQRDVKLFLTSRGPRSTNYTHNLWKCWRDKRACVWQQNRSQLRSYKQNEWRTSMQLIKQKGNPSESVSTTWSKSINSYICLLFEVTLLNDFMAVN